MTLEFHTDPEEGDTIEMYVGDVTIPGVYRAQEVGGGITEKYRTEIENQSGGQDEADAPPAARIEVEAWVRRDTFESLNALREERNPFDVQIGPFAFEEMGIRDLEGIVRAEDTNSMQLNLQLQEFREHIIQERNLSGSGGGSGGGSSGLENMSAEGPGAAWVDENGDGRDDRTGEQVPEMETVPLSPGQEWTHNIGSDQAWGRRVIDSSSGNAFPSVVANGANWAIQDVGFAGEIGSPSRNYAALGLTETGGESMVRNIYIADGAPMYSGDRGSTACHVQPNTSGNIVYSHMNVAGFPDNGIYASAPGGGAQMLVENCYGYNNGHANFRLARGEIRDTVSLLDGGGHSGNGPRAVWAWPPGPVNIDNCDLIATGGSNWNAVVSGENSGPSTVNLQNCGVEGRLTETNGGTINGSGSRSADPQNYADAIPGSPTDAAAGLGDGGE